MRTLKNVDLTPEQLPILADAALGFCLIRGAAGSGKTTTAVYRLRQLCAAFKAQRERDDSGQPVRVLVLTFNRTLCGYINQLANEQIQDTAGIDFTIETFSRWALHLVGQRNIIDDPGFYVRPLLRNLGGNVSANPDYFADEVNYIMGRFTPASRQEYLGVERTGRGRAPAVNQQLRKRLLTDVVAPYEARKQRDEASDWNDVALAAAAATPRQGYDIVVADETQDFSANQIRAIRAHLSDNHATTFIMDAAQRIYSQGFTWRETGIELRPQMVRTLGRNYRNTAEIARLAASLIRDLPMEEDGVLPGAAVCQESGMRPKLLAGTYSNQLAYMLNEIQPFLDNGDQIAILHPRGGGWFNAARNMLAQRNISYCELTRRREWPSGPEQVALSTIHSAKGLEFDHVLMPGLSQEITPHGDEDGDGTLDSLRRLLAMGIGRARRTVMLGYKPGEESTLIGLLDPATYDFVEV